MHRGMRSWHVDFTVFEDRSCLLATFSATRENIVSKEKRGLRKLPYVSFPFAAALHGIRHNTIRETCPRAHNFHLMFTGKGENLNLAGKLACKAPSRKVSQQLAVEVTFRLTA